MRRPTLVFALLLLSTTPARTSVACVCATDVAVLPAPGTQDVPRNAKIWVVGGMLGRSQLRGGDDAWIGEGKLVPGDDARATQLFDPDNLAPDRSYRFRTVAYGPGTWFITGSREDIAPPARPAVRALWIAVRDHVAGGPPVAELGLDAGLDPDAALLHFVFTSERSRLSLITTTTSWRELGQPGGSSALPFAPGEHVSVAISAIDLAGNESLAVSRDIDVGRAVSTLSGVAHVGGDRAVELLAQAGCVRHDDDLTMRIDPFVVFGGAALSLASVLAVLGCLVIHLRRVRAAGSAVGEPVSLLVVERLARAVQRRGGVLATVGVVGVPALVVMGVGPMAIISTIVGCVGLRGFFIARSALQLIEHVASSGGDGEPSAAREPATAELLGHTVIVRSACEETRFDVSPRALAAARRHAVPTSIANRR